MAAPRWRRPRHSSIDREGDGEWEEWEEGEEWEEWDEWEEWEEGEEWGEWEEGEEREEWEGRDLVGGACLPRVAGNGVQFAATHRQQGTHTP